MMKKLAVALIMIFLVVLCACASNDEYSSFGLTVNEQLELAHAAQVETDTLEETIEEETIGEEITEAATTQAGTTAVTEAIAYTEGKITYVLNKNSKKFHYPDCSSAKDIKQENRADFYGTRDEAIDSGYSPCGRCKP